VTTPSASHRNDRRRMAKHRDPTNVTLVVFAIAVVVSVGMLWVNATDHSVVRASADAPSAPSAPTSTGTAARGTSPTTLIPTPIPRSTPPGSDSRSTASSAIASASRSRADAPQPAPVPPGGPTVSSTPPQPVGDVSAAMLATSPTTVPAPPTTTKPPATAPPASPPTIAPPTTSPPTTAPTTRPPQPPLLLPPLRPLLSS